MRAILIFLFFINICHAYSQDLNNNYLTNKANRLCENGRRTLLHSDFSGDSLFALFRNNKPILAHYDKELWLISNNLSKIFQFGNAIEYKLSPNNRFIALIDYLSLSADTIDSTIFKIFDLKNNKIVVNRIITDYAESGSPIIYDWSKNSNLFYFQVVGVQCVGGIYVYETNTNSLKVYNLPWFGGCYDYSINTDKKQLLYSDYILPIDGPPLADTTKLHLIIYDFETGEKKIIKENLGKDFNAKWIDANTFEYYDAKLKQRITKKI